MRGVPTHRHRRCPDCRHARRHPETIRELLPGTSLNFHGTEEEL